MTQNDLIEVHVEVRGPREKPRLSTIVEVLSLLLLN